MIPLSQHPSLSADNKAVLIEVLVGRSPLHGAMSGPGYNYTTHWTALETANDLTDDQIRRLSALNEWNNLPPMLREKLHNAPFNVPRRAQGGAGDMEARVAELEQKLEEVRRKSYPMSSGSDTQVREFLQTLGLGLHVQQYPNDRPTLSRVVGQSVSIPTGQEVRYHSACAAELYKLFWNNGRQGEFVIGKAPNQMLPSLRVAVPSGNADMMIRLQPTEALVPLDRAYYNNDLPPSSKTQLSSSVFLVDVKTGATLRDPRCVLSAVSKLVTYNLVSKGRITSVFHSDFDHDHYVEEAVFNDDCSAVLVQWIPYSGFETKVLRLLDCDHVASSVANLYLAKYNGQSMEDIVSGLQ